jgi:PAS domain S-box-containing protein
LQSLKDQTQRSTLERVQAEQRVQQFQRFAGFFESAADGMVVIDRTGRVLFANPRAREILGAGDGDVRPSSFKSLLAPDQEPLAERLMRGFEAGIYPRGIDLTLAERQGRTATVNVSFSSVLREDDAVLFTIRDVTQERETAVELVRTKEFLESVIESSVDAIVSADLDGTVRLFNRAAARVFGYTPVDVIGKLNVEALYPEGVARQIMRRIRDPNQSGFGRLEDYRVNMLGADGQSVPVLLSASLVVENGRPVGSLGIFTDLREKLRIQSELERAQEELRNREKQALIAELAGAAAHELNQPLTSVIGYAELLSRQLQGQPNFLKNAEVIVSEAQRMAEIVRKIGKLTRYETKSYVGEQKILDLDRASQDDPDSPREPR